MSDGVPNSTDDRALKSQTPAMPQPTAHSPKIGEYKKLWVEYTISILKFIFSSRFQLKKSVYNSVCNCFYPIVLNFH